MFSSVLSVVEPFAGLSLYEGLTSSWVDGSTVSNDVSMLATMRALLHERRKDQYFHFSYLATSRTADSSISDGNELFNSFYGNSRTAPLDANTLLWICCRSMAVHQFADQLLTSSNNAWTPSHGFTRLTAAEEYIHSKCGMEIVIFIKPDINSCFIFTGGINLPAYHLVQSFLPLYFPALFKENPLTAEEKHLLECLTKRTSDAYCKAMQDFGKHIGLEKMAIRSLLQDFEKGARMRQLREAESAVEHARDHAESLRIEYIRSLQNLDDSIYHCEGMRLAAENTAENKELMDYFLSHENLKLISAEDGNLEFIVTTHIDSFDAEGYAHLAKVGDIYNHFTDLRKEPFKRLQNRKILMDALFCENPKLKVRTCAYYRLNMNGDVSSCRGFNYQNYGGYENCIPNPHLYRHNCIGNNAPLITEQLRKGETLCAVECCIASAMAVNIHETGLTFRPFVQDVMNSDQKVIENMETHECFTAQEALAWLIEQQSTATEVVES